MRDFTEWLETFTPSVNEFGYYVDFEAVYRYTEAHIIELNILNSLIGCRDIEQRFRQIVAEYPKTLEVIPLLIAVRKKEIFAMDENGGKWYSFKKSDFSDIDELCYFMHHIGLFELLQSHLINNCYDYCLGVNVGLDTNTRKSRGGKQFAHIVETYLQDICYCKGFSLRSEVTSSEISRQCGIDFTRMGISTKKRFDFVVYGKEQIYCVECNFYNDGGSKLTEVSRSYLEIIQSMALIRGVVFIWITDGKIGWTKHRANLKEVFDSYEHVYNINDLHSGILNNVLK